MSLDKKLVLACVKDDFAEVERLTGQVPDIGRSSWTHTLCPLNSAASRGHTKIVRLLIEKGYSVNSYIEGPGSDISTALHRAVFRDNTDMAGLLVTLGADPESKVKSKHFSGSAIDAAKEYGNKMMLRILEEGWTRSASIGDVMKQSIVSHFKALPQKKWRLKFAVDIQEEIETEKKNESRKANETRGQLKQIREKIQSLEKEYRQLETERAADAARSRQHIVNLESGYGYISKDDQQTLISDIDLLTSVIVSMKSEIKDEDDEAKEDSDGLTCPVCLETPEEVYSCRSCGNFACGRCLPRLTSCPSCRKTFEGKRPFRNKLVERMMSKSEKNAGSQDRKGIGSAAVGYVAGARL